jgi:2-methylcitrate dehydratase PrpD
VTTDDQSPIAKRLAEWALQLSFDDIPADAVAAARKMILDQLGIQLRGATLPNVQSERHLVEAMGARGESTIALSGSRTVAPYAAYINGTFGNSCQYDDSHLLAWHPGSCVVPTALAFAERAQRSGRDVIAAVVAGTQVMALLGAVTTTAMQRVGWHGAKVLGVFGAAVAAGRLLDLSPDQLANALAIAASDSSGTMEYDKSGGEVKRLHAGSAARSGAQAAILAGDGLTGPLTIFEGAKGVFRLFGGSDDFAALTASWDRFHILDTIFRMYPAVGTVHSPLDAIRELQAEHGFGWRDVDQIRVGLSEYAVSHGGSITRPTDVISAQCSLAFSVGLLLVRGTNRPQDYFDANLWTDPDILGIGDRVRAYPMAFAPDTPALSSRVDIQLANGREFGRLQQAFHGHPARPASMANLEAKFRDNVAGIVSERTATSIIQTVAELDSIADARELTALIGAASTT